MRTAGQRLDHPRTSAGRDNVGHSATGTVANVIAAAILVFVPSVHHWAASGSWRLGVVVAAIVIGIPLLVGVISMLTLPADA